MTLKFVHPSTILVSGPTGCGKTLFVVRLILEDMLEPAPNNIIWIYSEWQDVYDKIKNRKPNIKFVKGTSSTLELEYDNLDKNFKNIIILDDQMSTSGDSKYLPKLFTEGSHHRNLSIIYIVQNLFDKGKAHRTASLNSQYVVLFKNPRDSSQIENFGRQIFPTNSKFVLSSFLDATKEPYGYLLLDLRPETPEYLRLRTNIFESEQSYVYITQEHQRELNL